MTRTTQMAFYHAQLYLFQYFVRKRLKYEKFMDENDRPKMMTTSNLELWTTKSAIG